MAKKKNKKSNRNDARGFNTGGTTTTSSNNTTTSSISSTSNHNKMKTSLVKIKSNQASTSKIIQSSSSYHQQKKKETLDLVGKSTRSIQVTSEAYNELMMLLDDIKQSIYEEKNDDDGDDDDDDDANSWMKSMIAPLLHDISMENKRLVKKVTSLVRCHNYLVVSYSYSMVPGTMVPGMVLGTIPLAAVTACTYFLVFGTTTIFCCILT